MSANLILHWILDTLDEDNTIADETDNHLNGAYAGNPQMVPDEKFGSCLYFDGDGDSITAPDRELLRLQNYTVEGWIKPEEKNGWQGIVGKPGRNYNIWIWMGSEGGYVHHRFHVGSSTNAGAPNTDMGTIVWGQWYHVAITNDGQTASTYINGVLQAQGAMTEDLVVDKKALIVGRKLDDGATNYYKGNMAHLRLYDDALTQDEIRRDMVEDESAASAFVRSHPVDFELYNQDNQHVLFIDDLTDQTLFLELRNSSTQDIKLNDIGQTVTSETYHFELQFRPETLALASLDQIQVATDGWSLDRAQDGTALYLLHQGETTLAAGETIALQLTGMNADGRGGTRGTRVQLVYDNLQYVNENSLLNGSRLQFLDIVNHQGRTNIPLHVGFVGGDTVLSDGISPNTLRLRIANISDSGLSLSTGDATTPSSHIKVSFDVQEEGETREWALTDASTADGVLLRVVTKIDGNWVSDPNWRTPEKSNLGQTVEWTITPSEDTTLEADGYIILELSLVALASIGHANLYINFENIPGYQDEQMVVVVQKSPLLYSNSSVKIDGSLGIGTASPKGKLHVTGDLVLGLDEENKKFIFHPRANRDGDFLQIAPDKEDGNWNWGQGITLRRDGAVGIGTTSPGDYKLNVKNGNTLLGGALTVQNSVSIGTDGSDSYKLNVDGGNTYLGGTLTVEGEISSKRYQFSVDNKYTARDITDTREYIIKFTERLDPFNIYNNNRFEAPTSGYYFFTATVTFLGRMHGEEGYQWVYFGIYRNGDQQDINTQILALTPREFSVPTAQSITAMMNLNQGDFVDVRLELSEKLKERIQYSSFKGYMISK